MYERFTDLARETLRYANDKAIMFNHEYVGTEHLLLGLIENRQNVACDILKNLDIDIRKIRLEIEKIIYSHKDQVLIGKLPHTHRAKKVIEYAIEAAKEQSCNYIGTEHLLLGLLKEKEGIAANVLKNLNITTEIIENAIDLMFNKKTKTNLDIKFLETQKENAVRELDFGKAMNIKKEIEQLKWKIIFKEKEEDTSIDHKKILQKIACILFLNFKGDWSDKKSI